MRAALLVVVSLLAACKGEDPYTDDTDITGLVDADGDGSTNGIDCNDDDADIGPGQPEICDGIDQDCDEDIDEEPTDGATFYADADADGFGDEANPRVACQAPTGTVAIGGDCDDARALVNPDADELCNDRDDDCSGEADEEAVDMTQFYVDADDDGFGDAVGTLACDEPAGQDADDGDCDDGDADIHPDAPELCNLVDDDCDGTVDDDPIDAQNWFPDLDLDGYGDPTGQIHSCDQPVDYITDRRDCDDGDADVHPGVAEVCDGVDQNCNGQVDDSATGATSWYRDADHDGFGTGNAIVACDQPPDTVEVNGDCDDRALGIFPGADELCNAIDDDCDGTEDEEAVDAGTWYADADGDTFGAGSPIIACAQPIDTVTDSTDCDDTDAATNPLAIEVCNSIDDDCDGDVDDGAADGDTWFADADGDGFGAGSAIFACDPPADAVDNADDCDDTAAETHPGADETCDGTDEDCDGTVDEDAIDPVDLYPDADGDQHGDDTAAIGSGCTVPLGQSANHDDCDDADAATYLGAPQACDGVDNDCDGAFVAADEDGLATFFDATGLPTDLAGSFTGADVFTPSAGTLNLCAGTWDGRIRAQGDLTIQGFGAAILDGGGAHGVVRVSDGSAVQIRDLTLQGGSDSNGTVFSNGDLTATRVEVLDSTSPFSTSGLLTLDAVNMTDTSEGWGGAAGVVITNSTFDGHTGAQFIHTAGALSVFDSDFSAIATGSDVGSLEVEDSVWHDSSDGLYVHGDISLVGSTFADNTAPDAVINVNTGDPAAAAVLEDTRFERNTSRQAPFSLYYALGGSVQIRGVTAVDNSSTSLDGGSLNISVGSQATPEGTIDVDGSSFTGNAAPGGGGGGAMLVADAITVTDSHFDANTATNSAGLGYTAATIDIAGSTFDDNVGPGLQGGAAAGTLTGSSISRNQDGLRTNGDFAIASSTIDDNEGYGVDVGNGAATCDDSSIRRNLYAGVSIFVVNTPSFAAAACDLGVGGDDNLGPDVHTEAGDFAYGDDATFFCDRTGCTP